MDDQDPSEAAVRDLELTAELCHELNQPLTAVLANLSVGRERLGEVRAGRATVRDGEIAEIIEQAYLGADHMARLLRATCRGAREIVVQERVALSRVLDDALAIASDEIRGRAQILCDYNVAPTVLGSELRLRQAFVNLIVNAAQSLPDAEPEHNWLAVRMWSERPGQIIVEVKDTGAGTPEDLGEVTRPMFTTRSGRGRGLGLTISKRVIEAHGGELLLVRRAGRGTRARVVLPCLPEARDGAGR